MAKILFNTDEEYFKFCTDNAIGDMVTNKKTYHLMHSTNDDWKACEYMAKLKSWDNETISIEIKPKHYPCVALINAEDDFYGNVRFTISFVYKEDFD